MNQNQEEHTALSQTLQELTHLSRGLLDARVGLPDEVGWIRGTALLENPELFIPELLTQLHQSLGGDSRKVVASFLLKDWLRQVVLASTGAYLLAGRIPDVRIENLAFRRSAEGRATAIAFLSDHIHARDDDQAGGETGVTSVPAAALRQTLRDTLGYGYAGPLIRTLRPFVPVSERFMWSTTADTIVGFTLLIIQRFDLPAQCYSEADALAAMEPWRGKTTAKNISDEAHGLHMLVRGCCCFAYHLDQYEKCKTCPLRPMEERIILSREAAGLSSG